MRLSVSLMFALSLPYAFFASKLPAAAEDVKPINVPKINTEADETDPFVSTDGLALLYSSNKKGTFDIWIAKRTTASGVFGSPAVYYGEKDADERGPFFFNQYLYFST